MMSPCAFYIDVYSQPDGHFYFMKLPNGSTYYRPIEGVIFPTLTDYKEYLENIYRVNLNLCVPKTSYLLESKYHALPDYCKAMNVPCAWLDFMYPRVFSFSLQSSLYNYEIGFENYPNRKCKVKSIYYYRKDW